MSRRPSEEEASRHALRLWGSEYNHGSRKELEAPAEKHERKLATISSWCSRPTSKRSVTTRRAARRMQGAHKSQRLSDAAEPTCAAATTAKRGLGCRFSVLNGGALPPKKTKDSSRPTSQHQSQSSKTSVLVEASRPSPAPSTLQPSANPSRQRQTATT